ncbi:MAG TPA: flavin reductase family protein [Candidatus Limnocylindrales bacterium]|nr:flavin reductase family protein [Candidatus Limnocylindrales bacterium]
MSTVAVSAAEFRDAMAVLAAPVAIATTRYAGRDFGFTASTVTAMSLDPPLISVAIDRSNGCHEPFVRAGEFVVSVLTERHRALAARFAQRGADKFAGGGTGTFPGSQLPAITGALALYRCTRRAVLPVGDHDLLVGELVTVVHGPAARPLVWYSRTFHTAEPA